MLTLTVWHTKYSTGGYLHIVTDDGNLEDDHIKFCIDYGAQEVKEGRLSEEDYDEGLEIANHLLSISLEKREELYNQFWDGYRTFMLPFMAEAIKKFM